MVSFFVNHASKVAVICFIGIVSIVGFYMHQYNLTQLERQRAMQTLIKQTSLVKKDTVCINCKIIKRSGSEIRTTPTEQLLRSTIK
jgi:competence protein ComGC